MGDKLDLKRTLKEFYQPPREPVLADVPEMAFLMIDGEGYPETSQRFQDAMAALYGMSYTLKFALKAEGSDFAVMPLEALWWADDMEAFLEGGEKDDWKWTAMIAQPDFITAAHVEAAREAVAAKAEREAAKAASAAGDAADAAGDGGGGVGGLASRALGDLRFERWREGLSAHVMHYGPYSEEGPTIAALHDFIAEQGYVRRDRHHEIYLGDPRRAKPENLKTVIRQPVG